ncbi:hypothetical protein [Haladaptatus salinisoli]|uniref:hypothetical protein n=1 Tax=Haladaptatus salinisoli TaxID=2884876 RepID=UPI001D0A9F2B|nr:hypothetical protein [Haladaptatus salinisoli]
MSKYVPNLLPLLLLRFVTQLYRNKAATLAVAASILSAGIFSLLEGMYVLGGVEVLVAAGLLVLYGFLTPVNCSGSFD